MYIDRRIRQAAVVEFARRRIPRSTSELKAVRRTWYALRYLSISSSEKPMVIICVGDKSPSAMGISQVSPKISPNPPQSINMIASFLKARNFNGSLLKTGKSNFHGITLGSPLGPKSIPSNASWDWYTQSLPLGNDSGDGKGGDCWYCCGCPWC